MSENTTKVVLAGVERCRKRLWAHCYRMTGRRIEADDLTQEAIARAIERSGDLDEITAIEGWLFRIATTVCLDHLRRNHRVHGATELVDPIIFEGLAGASGSPETGVLLREDVRLAVVTALQHLRPKQRAAVLLHDVCGLALDEVSSIIGSTKDAAKAALHRGRAELERARGRTDVDVPVDAAVVERLARAIEDRSVSALAALVADDVWGVVDGGDTVPVASRPTFGARALLRRFANISSRVTATVACRVERLNAEPAVFVSLRESATVFASVHVETRHRTIVAMRVVLDPEKLAPFQPANVGSRP